MFFTFTYTYTFNLVIFFFRIIMQVVPKDPHLVVNYTKIIMTLPTMVGDANLGLQYLKTAFQTSQNDVTVLKAIGKTIEAYYNEVIVMYNF